MARIPREAYKLGGVLNQADVSLLIGVRAGTIGKDIKDFQLENNVVLPYRGTIHDIGPTLTHKKIIIQQFVRNIPTQRSRAGHRIAKKLVIDTSRDTRRL